MITSPPVPGRPGFVLRAALLASLIFAVTSCGNSSSTTTVTPDAKKASTALNAGLKAHSAGKLNVASTDYQQALKYDHKNKFALYNLGLIDAANGNYGLAEEKYRRVLGFDPKYGPALFNLAILRTGRGDSKEAITLYEQAVAADGKAAAAWLNLGLLQRASGQRSAGDKSVLKAISLNPKLKDPTKAKANPVPVKPAS
jgi:tetratricopeptide (TPR) repeat protein